MIAKLDSEATVIARRVGEAEEHITQLSEDSEKIQEVQHELQERQDGVIWRACQSLQGLFQGMEGRVHDLGDDLKSFHADVEKFQNFATQRVQQLFDGEEQVREQLKFLMEASEMLKRRSREFNKNHTAQLK